MITTLGTKRYIDIEIAQRRECTCDGVCDNVDVHVDVSSVACAHSVHPLAADCVPKQAIPHSCMNYTLEHYVAHGHLM